MTITESTLIKDIAVSNYNSIYVFEQYNIDYCCNGNRSLIQVCEELNLEVEEIITEINLKLSSSPYTGIDMNLIPLDVLTKYIQDKHHRYVEEKIPIIKDCLDKVTQVHGNEHPELFEISTLFIEAASRLTKHMKKEELILFPQINQLVIAERNGLSNETTSLDSITSVICQMESEHDDEGERFARIKVLSKNFSPPQGACVSFKNLYILLQEFEQDLHTHIHIENNVLFPRSINLEQELL